MSALWGDDRIAVAKPGRQVPVEVTDGPVSVRQNRLARAGLLGLRERSVHVSGRQPGRVGHAQLGCHIVVVGPPGLVRKTTSGKVRRGACRQAWLAGEIREGVFVSPAPGAAGEEMGDVA